jgi:LmbE family N-acetylglucosaminyl deacetylase
LAKKKVNKAARRWVYLSPHFDDAVLSCGGLIQEQTRGGTPVEIWTIFAGNPGPVPLSPVAQASHAAWNTGSAEETVTLRQVEDRNAAHILGVQIHHFTILDCIYRFSPQAEWLYPQTVFAPIHPAESGLADRISAELDQELKPDDILVCPLALGKHIDHVLVRVSAERLGRSLRYYADIPYLVKSPETLKEARSGLRSKIYSISEDGLLAWQAGIAAYASQIVDLFITLDNMQEVIHGYWQARQGIRLWRAA